MQTKKFQRKIENFECENCEELVKGNGYTNHCPKCLYSKHVDINPGDRAESCKKLMIPSKTEIIHGKLIITHTCLCGEIKRVKSREEDNKRILNSLLNA